MTMLNKEVIPAKATLGYLQTNVLAVWEYNSLNAKPAREKGVTTGRLTTAPPRFRDRTPHLHALR
jgi:hypothetical protein